MPVLPVDLFPEVPAPGDLAEKECRLCPVRGEDFRRMEPVEMTAIALLRE